MPSCTIDVKPRKTPRMCASVALSRVVLGLHYPSDVLAAVGLGWALSETSSRLLL